MKIKIASVMVAIVCHPNKNLPALCRGKGGTSFHNVAPQGQRLFPFNGLSFFGNHYVRLFFQISRCFPMVWSQGMNCKWTRSFCKLAGGRLSEWTPAPRMGRKSVLRSGLAAWRVERRDGTGHQGWNPLSAKWPKSWCATMIFSSITGFWHPISDAFPKIICLSEHSGEIMAFHQNQ